MVGIVGVFNTIFAPKTDHVIDPIERIIICVLGSERVKGVVLTTGRPSSLRMVCLWFV